MDDPRPGRDAEELRRDKPTPIIFRVVIDGRDHPLLILSNNLPIGGLTFDRPPTAPGPGMPIPVLPPNTDPMSKTNLVFAFVTSKAKPSHYLLRLSVPPEQCPSTIDRESVKGGAFVIKVKLYTDNLTTLEDTAVQIYDEANSKYVEDLKQLPMLVQRMLKLDENRPRILKFVLPYTDVDNTLVTENLMNDLVFPDPAIQRTVEQLRILFAPQPEGATYAPITLYIRDEQRTPWENEFRVSREELEIEKTHGNIWRHFYTEKLQKTRSPHHIGSGTSLKPPRQRPQMTGLPSLAYSTVFEMTTRLGVATKQVMEAQEATTFRFNTAVSTIRMAEKLGAGDTEYFAYLRCRTAIRLKPGDKLDIHFRPTTLVPSDKWTFTVLNPFAHNAQTEIAGVISRPREPKDATEALENGPGEYINMKLPVSKNTARTIDESCDVLEKAQPVQCVVDFSASGTSGSRIIQGLANVMLGSRLNLLHKDQRDESENLKDWGKFLTMRDARVYGRDDIFPSDLAIQYLKSQLPDEDHAKVLEYLFAAPVNRYGQVISAIIGSAGTGKTFLISRIAVAALLTDPNWRVMLTSTANHAVNLLAREVDRALSDVISLGPEYEERLQGLYCTRVHSDTAEMAFFLAQVNRELLQAIAGEQESVQQSGSSDEPSSQTQLEPPIPGVKGPRYVVRGTSVAARALQRIEMLNAPGLLSLWGQYVEEGVAMGLEDFSTFKAAIKKALNIIKGEASIVCITLSGVAAHIRSLGAFDLFVSDEANRINIADWCLLLSAMDVQYAIFVGNDKQLPPIAPMIQGHSGLSKELRQSILCHLRTNHWPIARLYLNRRGGARIPSMFNRVRYSGDILYPYEGLGCSMR